MTPPFQRCLAVDSDLSIAAVDAAVTTWLTNHGSLPLILWVHPNDYVIGCKVAEDSFRHLTVLCDPSYAVDSWSVGTRFDKGFGSEGA